MRIAMVSTPFVAVPPRDYGGTELVIHELTTELANRGHDITLFATGDSDSDVRLRYLYPSAQWPPDPLLEVDHVTWAFREIARGGYDIAHVHSAPALAVARLVPELPMVYTLHHDRVPSLSAFYRRFPHVQFVAISHDQRRREEPLPRCEVVHHGLDVSRYGCAPDVGDYVCFIGRYSEVKGPHTAIDAARAAGVPIRLAGPVHPPDEPFVARELSHRLTLDGVSDMGPAGPEAKRALLAGARALLAPITWNEPFGLVLIEAMLSGCPPVAFRRGAAPELIEEGVTGFVVDTEAEMADRVRPGGAVDRFDRLRCRERAIELFGRERMVRDYERIYEAVAEDADDSGPAPIEVAV